jgi:hypothetical protein
MWGWLTGRSGAQRARSTPGRPIFDANYRQLG